MYTRHPRGPPVFFFTMVYTDQARSVIDALIAILHVAGIQVPEHESFEQRAHLVTHYVAQCAAKALTVSQNAQCDAELSDARFDVFLNDEAKGALRRKHLRARKKQLKAWRAEVLDVLGRLNRRRPNRQGSRSEQET